MLLNLGVYIAELWLLGSVLLLLHRLRASWGLVAVGVFTTLLHLSAPLGAFIRLDTGLTLSLGGNLLLPVIFLGVLILYIHHDGTRRARLAIYSVVGITGFVFLAFLSLRLHLSLDGGGNLAGLAADNPALRVDIWVTLASITAFIVDMYVLVIVFQGIINRFRRCPVWLAVVGALLVSLWSDALLYQVLASVGQPNFTLVAPGNLVGKSLAPLLLTPVIVGYLLKRQHELRVEAGRAALDVVFGSTDDIRTVLTLSRGLFQQTDNIYRQLTENINEVFWLTNIAGMQNYYVSPAYEKIWGRSVTELYQKHDSLLTTILPEDRARFLEQRQAWTRGDYTAIEYRIVRPDGAIRWIRHRAFPIHNDEGQVYRLAGVAEDITQLKEAEQHQLDLALEKERNRLMRESISDISHDLKTPLSIINTKVDLIKRTVSDPARQTIHLNELEFQSIRLGKMIDDLLTLSRLENVKALTYRLIDINQVVETLNQDYASLAETRRLRVVLDLQSKLPTVPVDQVDIKRALSNLVENALFYTEAGGTITLRTRMVEDTLVVEVSDTGIGIAPDSLPHIFDRFYRANRQRKTEKGGTGLGLAIVKKVVEMHGGEIRVTSTLGVGTTFNMSLPTIWPRPEPPEPESMVE